MHEEEIIMNYWALNTGIVSQVHGYNAEQYFIIMLHFCVNETKRNQTATTTKTTPTAATTKRCLFISLVDTNVNLSKIYFISSLSLYNFYANILLLLLFLPRKATYQIHSHVISISFVFQSFFVVIFIFFFSIEL